MESYTGSPHRRRAPLKDHDSWSMDAVSAMPKGILESAKSPHHSYCGGASQGRWHCVCTQHVHADQVHYTLYVWHTPQRQTNKNSLFVKLSHWQLQAELKNSEDDFPVPPLLALQVSPQTTEMAFIYAANPHSGALVLWRISREDLKRPLGPPNSALAVVPVNDWTLLSSDSAEATSHDLLTSLTVSWTLASSPPVILLGTESGRIFWVEQTNIPIALHVVEVKQEESTASVGLLTRLLRGSPASPSPPAVESPIVTNLSIDSSDDSNVFVSISETGRIVAWTVTPTESHRALFSSKPIFQLDASSLPEGSSVTKLQVLTATWNGQSQQLHILFLAFSLDDTSRLYWARLSLDDAINSAPLQNVVWLNRFADPHNDVLVAGLVAADNGMAYTVLTVEPDQNCTETPPHYIRLGDAHHSTCHSTLVMALEPSSGDVQEENVVLPKSAATVLPGTLAKDMVTHGVSIWDTSGMRIRMRYKMDSMDEASAFTPSDPNSVKKLTVHLESVFWESYKHPNRTIRLPPSLANADAGNLEQAIVNVAIVLQQKGDVSSSENPVEWHLALIKLLHQTGIYRSLSSTCRWKLLSIGQQVSAFWALRCMPPKTPWEEAQVAKLASTSVAEWLEGIQESVLNGGGGESRETAFLEWFCKAAEDALNYRQEYASKETGYDVNANKPPLVATPEQVPVWTSHPSLCLIWKRQLAHWTRNLSTTATQNVVETMVAFTLQAHQDLYTSCPNAETKADFCKVQKDAFELVRKVNGWKKDQFAFDLCVAHCYFGGLCQIAVDHEKRGDRATFSLEPLFEQLGQETDVGSGMRFGLFVLQWHTERGYFGHVLKYGEHCPDDLAVLMNNEAALRPFRWIHAIGQGDYDSATTSLLENASNETTKLSTAMTALACASVSNRVVENETSDLKENALKRRRIIDKKRELAVAQEELLGESGTLLPPERLLDILLQKLQAAQDPEQKADLCFIGLAICSGFDSSQDAVDNAIKIWHCAINADMAMWQNLLNSETDLTDPRLAHVVLESTVFGSLLRQSRDMQSQAWDNVVFRRVENGMLAALDATAESEWGTKMHRLLRSAAGLKSDE